MQESDIILEKAVDEGIDFFDTARVYTDSEEKMGRVLSKHRDKLKIASKTYSRTAEKASEDVEISLKLLKTDYLDLYQCHNISTEEDFKTVTGPGGALEALRKAQEAGKIRWVGVSGHKPWIMEKLLDYFDTAQFPFNIIENKALETLIPKAKEKGVGTITMKPIAGGSLQHIGLNLRYILYSGMDVAIPGMDKPEQVAQNLSVLENLKPLTDDELNLLESERTRLGEQFCRRCEYCMPCPEGLNISFLHLIRGYYFNYNLKEWALGRLESLPKKYEDCIACGECIKKCPYDLDMPKIFQETAEKIKQDSTK